MTGLCSRRNCPLANSQYATVREENGKLYLYMKTIERSFTPNKLWERVLLSRNFATALQQIDENLAYWSSHLRTKCKARFVRLTQVLIRMRKLALNPDNRELHRRHKKVERREKVRAKKAEAAAMIDHQIKKELFSRLLKGTYPTEVVDLDKGLQKLLQNPISNEEKEREAENELEYENEREYEVEEEEEDGEAEEAETYPVEYVEGDFYDDDDDDDELDDVDDDVDDDEIQKGKGAAVDIEDLVGKKKSGRKSVDEGVKRKSVRKTVSPVAKKRKPYVEIEYEQETDVNTESNKN